MDVAELCARGARERRDLGGSRTQRPEHVRLAGPQLGQPWYAGIYSHPGRTKIDHAVIGAMMIMLMPHWSRRL